MLGKSDWLRGKGELGEQGCLEGEDQLTVLKTEATTELGNPTVFLSAALGSWSEQSNLLPSTGSKEKYS